VVAITQVHAIAKTLNNELIIYKLYFNKAGGAAQAVEQLPSKCKALSSNPSIIYICSQNGQRIKIIFTI
jgi:hypothetical protein